VRLENISHHIEELVAPCSGTNPEVWVAARNGNLLYPPPVESLIPSTACGLFAPIELPPGGIHVIHPHVVLSGPSLQAVVHLQHGSEPGTSTAPTFDIATRPQFLALTVGQRPGLTLTTSPHVSVDVQSGDGHGSTLFFAYSARCLHSDGTGDGSDSNGRWDSTSGTQIPLFNAPCLSLEIHLVAGYPGHPVATFDYRSPDEPST
jgi:hypothetical protein